MERRRWRGCGQRGRRRDERGGVVGAVFLPVRALPEVQEAVAKPHIGEPQTGGRWGGGGGGGVESWEAVGVFHLVRFHSVQPVSYTPVLRCDARTFQRSTWTSPC